MHLKKPSVHRMRGIMRKARRSLRALSLASFLLILAAPGAGSQTPSSRPTLVVFFTIDQMRPDYFSRFEKQLNGGLARLYHAGAFFENAYQDHAITETAPGHSATLSGRFPRSTGITTNSLGVQDDRASLLSGASPGASPFRFRGSTLIDWLRVADPRSRALSISRKDRGAILPLGRAHEEVYWFAPDRFTTSTYYHDTLPSWIDRFNARQLPQRYADKLWTLLLAEREYPEPDSVPLENGGRNYTFPHRFPSDSSAAARVLAAFPMMDEVTLQAALAGVEALKLGKGPQTDLLAVSLSTTDAVGHAFGPDSREIHDQILRLDRYLGAFLDSLFKLRDSTRVLVALTADHGVQPFPAIHAARVRGAVARYADVDPAYADLLAGVAARGIDTSALQFAEGMLLVDRSAFARAHVDVDSTLRRFAEVVRKVPGVGRVDFVRALAQADTVRDAVARRWLHMLSPELPVELVVSLEPYAYWAGTRIATHGTPNDEDAHVPVVFWGAAIRAGRYGEFARVVDIAPTIAHALGVPPLERLDGHVLTRALR
ncbi:MAG TPA: alkaline phosphatase family protein [Gemmatimonadaceae bacterium]|nr:alkaline phosphatase family protein [Gemmatimonadaceae bacterium]